MYHLSIRLSVMLYLFNSFNNVLLIFKSQGGSLGGGSPRQFPQGLQGLNCVHCGGLKELRGYKGASRTL